ncbi:hypothetical protein JP74_18690 [Devosia sp. 17-2-E-8]|nr:hypothetical protein JP74_18690 [Devosia sp. 17-2-E-8]
MRKEAGWALLFSLTVPPAAWIVQLATGWALGAAGCTIIDRPAVVPAWADTAMLGVAIFGVAACLVCAVTGFSIWRRTSHEYSHHDSTLEDAGEGRTRFLAFCAVFAGLLFGLACLFNLGMAAMLPQCGP